MGVSSCVFDFGFIAHLFHVGRYDFDESAGDMEPLLYAYSIFSLSPSPLCCASGTTGFTSTSMSWYISSFGWQDRFGVFDGACDSLCIAGMWLDGVGLRYAGHSAAVASETAGAPDRL
jgi:hypothetical protein